MTSKQALMLIGCAALFGWYAPDLSGAGDAGEGGKSAADSRRGDRGDAAMRSWNAGETVLVREPDGHFYANVQVDGGQFRFLVDTGASMVALTGEDAEAIGLYWDEDSLRQVGRGANGVVRGVPVTIPRMEVDGFEARDVEAAIIPEGLDISLLGQSFLSRIDNVEISGDEMRLGG